jgi:serine/threonine protein kinase
VTDSRSTQNSVFGLASFSARPAGASGVLVRSLDGRTLQKLFYQQVLQSSYNHHSTAGVQLPRPLCLRHPHVVEVLQRLTDVEAGSDIPRVVGVTMAYAGRPLPDVLHTLTPADREKIALQIHEALRFAEGHNITHGDLLPKNVLVQRGTDGGVIARITNFPYSRMYLTTAANSEMRALFTATELRDPMNATSAADVFSFGVLLWWLATGGILDHSLGLSAYQIRAALTTRRRPPLTAVGDPRLRLVIAGCWQHDGGNRWSWTEVGTALTRQPNTRSKREHSELPVLRTHDPLPWFPLCCEFPLYETAALEASGRLVFDKKDTASDGGCYGEVFRGMHIDDTGIVHRMYAKRDGFIHLIDVFAAEGDRPMQDFRR